MESEHVDAYLVVKMGGGTYAIEARLIREITEPTYVVSVPKTPAHIAGMLQYRETVVPLINMVEVLDSLYNDGEGEPRQQLLILQAGDVTVAVLIDAVLKMKHAKDMQIDPLPFVTHRNVARFCKGMLNDDGRRHIVLDVRALFRELNINCLAKETVGVDNHTLKASKYTVFSLDHHLFAASIATIKRIIAAQDIIVNPRAHPWFKGTYQPPNSIYNLPVVDCFKVFGIKEPDLRQDGRLDIIERNIIISPVNGNDVGFYVGTIADIISLGEDQLFPLPSLLKTRENAYLEATAIVTNDILHVVDLSKVLQEKMMEGK